jgi:Na+-transporting NADH:ubiquinone oxidoreductase subunit A
MTDIIKIKRGLDIPLYGKAAEEISRKINPERVGIVPDDYPGYTWKLSVHPGDNVAIGTPLLYAKDAENIKIVSPANGVVTEVVRGERRKIETVVVKCGKTNISTPQFKCEDNRESIIEMLCQSGLWAMMRQRPYDIIPSPYIVPRDIFITTFDSAPLAGPMMTPSQNNLLEQGIKLLSHLTDGKVYIGVRFGSGISCSSADVYEFQGPHPAGNIGTQIAAIKPVNKGEVVWTLEASTVIKIALLLNSGVVNSDTIVALTGSELNNPTTIQTIYGADMSDILKDELPQDISDIRVISGNVLTGKRVSPTEGYLRYPYRQVTAIKEGKQTEEVLGWASVSPKKYSVKRSFPAFLRGLAKPFDFDARIKGGHRAMIVSGEYDKVFPMDIYPEYLIKAIQSRDIDKMEKLGIYEVAPEDFALAEFVDTSKLELQKIVREGLDFLRKETE